MESENVASSSKAEQSKQTTDYENEQEEDIDAAECNQNYDQSVKSTAVVKYAAVNSPARFCKLQSNTDLNLPPDNWLRSDKCRILKGVWNAYSSHMAFSSLYMANAYLDSIGEVDVVSDAKNIKKLLKIPYSKTSISMMVHRIGKTLLLDDFDIQRHLLQTAKKEWQWLRKFYFNHVLQTLRHKGDQSFCKNRRRDHLQHKNMVSKFLYYSIADSSEGRRDSDGSGSPSRRTPMEASQKSPPPDLEEDQNVFDHNQRFQRNIVWNFEDICMLLGTDMPIFGGGTHPCVSLRLRDILKPINILTGLDYWLDNLMCNVPEVMMCYHLEGIVQKYERIKTEDIPKLDNSKFSPNVVKYIAQNILSFLKSKATKAGHTYWLIKAKDDEAVKLYDLTTLCAEDTDDEQNPFTVPVGMLLYRVARNLITQEGRKNQQSKISTLLENCLRLLDIRKHPEIVTAAHFLLSDIYVPSTLDLSAPLLTNEESDMNLNCDNDDGDDVAYLEPTENEVITTSSLDVNALCLPDRTIQSDKLTTICPSPSRILEDRCQVALKHTEEGLSCIQLTCQESHKDGSSHCVEEESQKTAKPLEAIPLPFKTDDVSGEEFSDNGSDKMHLQCKEASVSSEPPWQSTYNRLLLQKACISSYAMAYWLSNTHECGSAMRYLELALLTYDAVEYIASQLNDSSSEEIQVLPCYMLGLAGDLNFMLIQNKSQLRTYELQYKQFNNWEGIRNCALNILNRNSYDHWAVFMHTKMEDTLLNSHQCYSLALEKVGCKETKLKIQQRLGNIKNELGVYYMSQATNLYNETYELTEVIEQLWKLSSDYLKAGAKLFEEINDDANISLLYSNIARLYRLQACCHGSNIEGCRLFTSKEKFLYEKAISFYQMALRNIGSGVEFEGIRNSISWDLCTTYFTMASLLQDYPPVSEENREKVEKDITELMLKALKFCESESQTCKPIYQYRAAIIQKRLGSLHHHSYRCAKLKKKRPQRTLAEMHLSKAADLFKMLEDSSEYLKVQLERIGLWESHFATLSGHSAKEKCLKILLEIILDTIPVLSLLCEKQMEDGSKEDESSGDRLPATTVTVESKAVEEIEEATIDHLKLLQQQVLFVLLNFVKLYSKSTSTQTTENQKLVTLKKMYSEALQQPSSGMSNSPHFLMSTLSKIKSLYETLNL